MAPRPTVFTTTILLLLAATPALAQHSVKPAPLRTDSEVVQKAQKGDPTSQFLVGMGYEMTGEVVNFEEAMKWYRKAADQGQPEAQNALGFLYQTGRGVPQDFTEAVRWYRKSADQGDPNGQSNLAKMYFEGTGVAQDSSEAANWYRKSAEQGWAWGQAELAHLYATGKGVPADLVSAYMWCSLAAAANQPHWGCKEMLLEIAPRMKPAQIAEARQRAYAWFEQRSKDPKQKHWAVGPNTLWGIDTDEQRLTAHLGLMYAEGDGVPKDDAEAVRWYQLGAQRGDAAAESYMGERYYLGNGVPKDYAQAFALFKSSAEQGYADGQHNLATCYHEGIGVAKNDAEAVKWWRAAAEQGLARSLHNLGAAYYEGWGVPKEEATAYQWLRIAQALGDEDPNVWRMAAELSEKQLKDANLKVAEWFKGHDGDPRFQAELAYMYFRGEGVAKDPAEAANWARRAADNGNARAQFLLGLMCETGTGVAKDETQAVNWFRKAAEQGFAPAQVALGAAYAQGNGVTKDEAEAVKWVRAAAEQGDSVGQGALGRMYETGRGVDPSVAEAVKWYLKAAEQGNSMALNNLGWLYATSTDPNVRNPEKALAYALKAVAATEEKDAGVLDTLAEAYFVNGRYKEAIETERKALTLEPKDSFKESLKKYEDAAKEKKQ